MVARGCIVAGWMCMVAMGHAWLPGGMHGCGGGMCGCRGHLQWGVIGKNMPQTSNSLLSPTKSMVARGNQW